MLSPNLTKFGLTPDKLRGLLVAAACARTRERLVFIYELALFDGGVRAFAREHSARNERTCLGWVHAFNRGGPGALAYVNRGGRKPLPLLPRRLPAA